MSTEYNISNLFLSAFGLKVADSFGIKPDELAQAPKGFFKGISIIDDEITAAEMSSFGTPILFPVKFLSGTYKKYNNKGEIVEAKMSDFRLPIASIVSFDREKMIGVTNINGGNGSVKEIFGFADWNIKINGFFIPDTSQPQGLHTIQEQETELLKWEQLACSIEVAGEFFTSRRIKYLTIKSLNIEPLRGQPKIRTFTIDALSDEPIELNIKNQI